MMVTVTKQATVVPHNTLQCTLEDGAIRAAQDRPLSLFCFVFQGNLTARGVRYIDTYILIHMLGHFLKYGYRKEQFENMDIDIAIEENTDIMI